MFSSLRRPSPALIVASLALFVALGGSAVAVTDAASPYQRRCAQGAVRAIVFVTGNAREGISNVPDRFTSDAQFFGHRWSCTGGAGAISVRRANAGIYDVRIPGNPATMAIASGRTNQAVAASAERLADGTFRVHLGGGSPSGPFTGKDVPFALFLF
jgi:hypothetical protein